MVPYMPLGNRVLDIIWNNSGILFQKLLEYFPTFLGTLGGHASKKVSRNRSQCYGIGSKTPPKYVSRGILGRFRTSPRDGLDREEIGQIGQSGVICKLSLGNDSGTIRESFSHNSSDIPLFLKSVGRSRYDFFV